MKAPSSRPVTPALPRRMPTSSCVTLDFPVVPANGWRRADTRAAHVVRMTVLQKQRDDDDRCSGCFFDRIGVSARAQSLRHGPGSRGGGRGGGGGGRGGGGFFPQQPRQRRQLLSPSAPQRSAQPSTRQAGETPAAGQPWTRQAEPPKARRSRRLAKPGAAQQQETPAGGSRTGRTTAPSPARIGRAKGRVGARTGRTGPRTSTGTTTMSTHDDAGQPSSPGPSSERRRFAVASRSDLRDRVLPCARHGSGRQRRYLLPMREYLVQPGLRERHRRLHYPPAPPGHERTAGSDSLHSPPLKTELSSEGGINNWVCLDGSLIETHGGHPAFRCPPFPLVGTVALAAIHLVIFISYVDRMHFVANVKVPWVFPSSNLVRDQEMAEVHSLDNTLPSSLTMLVRRDSESIQECTCGRHCRDVLTSSPFMADRSCGS